LCLRIIWFCADVEKYLCFRISHLCLCISAVPTITVSRYFVAKRPWLKLATCQT